MKSLGPGKVVHAFNPRRPRQGDLLSSKSVRGQPRLSSEVVEKPKAGDNVIEQGFQLQQVAELSSFGHVALALESRIEGTTGTIDAG